MLSWTQTYFRLDVSLLVSSAVIFCSRSQFFSSVRPKQKRLALLFPFSSCLHCVEAGLPCYASLRDRAVILLESLLALPPRIQREVLLPWKWCCWEKRLAQSLLATLCITRMQMSYEAIHLLEMPPWFQFESCLQSHCVSPLLHVKEVSLCERSEGDNCT